jgi:hypothetical protein
MISGFGGKQGSLSSRSIGKQSVADRCGSADSLIRAIAAAILPLGLTMLMT